MYSTVYNKAYSIHIHNGCINKWGIRKIEMARTIQTRKQLCIHILTLSHTQLLGKHIDESTFQIAKSHLRLCELGELCLLRILQARIIAYLWRPAGELFKRNMPMDLLIKATPDGGVVGCVAGYGRGRLGACSTAEMHGEEGAGHGSGPFLEPLPSGQQVG